MYTSQHTIYPPFFYRFIHFNPSRTLKDTSPVRYPSQKASKLKGQEVSTNGYIRTEVNGQNNILCRRALISSKQLLLYTTLMTVKIYIIFFKKTLQQLNFPTIWIMCSKTNSNRSSHWKTWYYRHFNWRTVKSKKGQPIMTKLYLFSKSIHPSVVS